ncbi:MAG: spore protease YyaC [Thermaerobacter sp.]|nr:spore protease YyaC [Thermaerobacter sp.]
MGELWAFSKSGSRPYKVRSEAPGASAELALALRTLWRQEGAPELILCVGTDRSTGDALGPLVGSALERNHPRPYQVLGTLERPVHATNLIAQMKHDARLRHARILGIDASLGRLDDVGIITVGLGPLRPGAGVQKQLPAVGHYHLVATVNVGGFMEYFVLQNTRLSTVMSMAAVITDAITRSLTT